MSTETMSQPILFLDVDGVLNRTGWRPSNPTGLSSWIEGDPARRLTQLIADTAAAIVLASSWRIGRSLFELRQAFEDAHVIATVVDVTPVLAGRPRWHEIQAWLAARPDHVRFAIADDEWDMGPLAARHVRISPLCGLDDDACAALRDLLASRP